MTSNAYIATDGETVMKVGKADDVKRREKEIAILISFTVACLDKEAALRVERKMRDFVIEKGGIRKTSTIDWFRFDPRIYEMLCEFVAKMDAQPVFEKDLDEEIEELVTRYYLLIIEELRVEKRRLRDEIQQLHEAYRQLQQQHIVDTVAIYEGQSEEGQFLKESRQWQGDLREEIGELKAIIRMYKENRDSG